MFLVSKLCSLKALSYTLLLGIPFVLCGQQTLYYDRGDRPSWYATDAWSLVNDPPVYDQEWVDGRIADFGSGGAFNFDAGGTSPRISSEPVLVNGLLNSGSQVGFVGTSSIVVTVSFVGTDPFIDGIFQFAGRTILLGDFELVGGSILVSGSGGGADPNSHTVTVSGGVFNMSKGNRLSVRTTLVVDGGDFIVDGRENLTLGAVTVDNGNFSLGSNRGLGTISNVNIARLEGGGDGSILSTVVDGGSPSNGALSILTINQADDSEYAGTITGFGAGPDGDNTLQIVKSGDGKLTLSGSISDIFNTTTVSGGGLFINSSSTSFGDHDGTTAILIEAGAQFGGIGTITTLDGDHIVVNQGASLVAGADQAVGLTTYALGSGSVLNLSAAAGEADWLKFHLGNADTAGVTYDQILVSSGSVNIGSGAMGLDDFDFTFLGGFGPGTFTLISAVDLIGSLAAGNLSGELNGYDAILSRSGDDLILTVIPEPGILTLVFAIGAAAVIVLRRRSWGN